MPQNWKINQQEKMQHLFWNFFRIKVHHQNSDCFFFYQPFLALIFFFCIRQFSRVAAEYNPPISFDFMFIFLALERLGAGALYITGAHSSTMPPAASTFAEANKSKSSSSASIM